MELAPALPMIQGDRVQLQQIIINLVMNGIEAMQSVTDRPRELVIRSHQDEKQHVLVSVTDCGVGISAENADRLFNAFFTTKSDGMGMGLSICRSIVEAHGGRLWASANVPPGAMFQFALPVNADAESEVAHTPSKDYSMTSSAATSRPAGTARPSAFAVLRLMTRRKGVGVSGGRSAGFSPFRMRRTRFAPRSAASFSSGP